MFLKWHWLQHQYKMRNRILILFNSNAKVNRYASNCRLNNIFTNVRHSFSTTQILLSIYRWENFDAACRRLSKIHSISFRRCFTIFFSKNTFSTSTPNSISTSTTSAAVSLVPPSSHSHLLSSSSLSSIRSVISFYRLSHVSEEKLSSLKSTLIDGLSLLQVFGRIYISTEGINAQLSIPNDNIEKLNDFMNTISYFPNIFYNLSVSSGECSFNKLQVKIRDQVVVDGLPKNSYDLNNQPAYLEAHDFHEEIKKNVLDMQKKDPHSAAILLDVRNFYEIQIGHFEGATQILSESFKSFLPEMLSYLENLQLENEKEHPIYMYCTGGIRCSKAGAFLKSKGYQNVQMLKGGVTQYGHYIKSSPSTKSLFIGKNFTFDNRKGEDITPDKVAACLHCGSPSNEFTNCIVPSCNRLFVECSHCATRTLSACSNECHSIAQNSEKLAAHKALGSDARRLVYLTPSKYAHK